MPQSHNRHLLQAIVEKDVMVPPNERRPISDQTDLNGVNGGPGDEGTQIVDIHGAELHQEYFRVPLFLLGKKWDILR